MLVKERHLATACRKHEKTVSYNVGLQGLEQCLEGVLEGLLTQFEIREGSQELKGKEK